MGGYKINRSEKRDLGTVTTAYGLIVSNTDEPTRIEGTLQTLIDCIITDHINAEIFPPFASDTPLRTIGKTAFDHLATSVITNVQLIKASNVRRRKMFDRKTYIKELVH